MLEHVGPAECSTTESKDRAAIQTPRNNGEVVRPPMKSSLEGALLPSFRILSLS